MVATPTASLTIPVPPSPAALAAFRAEASAALHDGARSLAIDLDPLSGLESPVISALISILREARDCGAEVGLVATASGVLASLRVTALDKLFTVFQRSAAERTPIRANPVARRRLASRKAGRGSLAGIG